MDDILLMNRDVEHLMIQAGAKRCRGLEYDDKYDVLQFVHFSDVHRELMNWNRIVRYINHYSEYLSFLFHLFPRSNLSSIFETFTSSALTIFSDFSFTILSTTPFSDSSCDS